MVLDRAADLAFVYYRGVVFCKVDLRRETFIFRR